MSSRWVCAACGGKDCCELLTDTPVGASPALGDGATAEVDGSAAPFKSGEDKE